MMKNIEWEKNYSAKMFWGWESARHINVEEMS